MSGRRRRPDWQDRAIDALKYLVGLVGEIAKLIDAIRSIR